jgi:hypothetical protein
LEVLLRESIWWFQRNCPCIRGKIFFFHSGYLKYLTYRHHFCLDLNLLVHGLHWNLIL